jgi:hypothetical protein
MEMIGGESRRGTSTLPATAGAREFGTVAGAGFGSIVRAAPSEGAEKRSRAHPASFGNAPQAGRFTNA